MTDTNFITPSTSDFMKGIKSALDEKANVVFETTDVLVEGKKVFNTNVGVGKTKYSVNYHDGKKSHKDGSPFFDIKIFKNKKDLAAFEKDLEGQGYVNESLDEGKSLKDILSSIEKGSGDYRLYVSDIPNDAKFKAAIRKKSSIAKHQRPMGSDSKGEFYKFVDVDAFTQAAKLAINESLDEGKLNTIEVTYNESPPFSTKSILKASGAKLVKKTKSHWAKITGTNAQLLAYLKHPEYDLNDNIIKSIYPEILESLNEGKSKEASEVLQLMDDDEDEDYQVALATVLKKYPKLDKKKLEKELDNYV